jgi:hypothetical protein
MLLLPQPRTDKSRIMISFVLNIMTSTGPFPRYFIPTVTRPRFSRITTFGGNSIFLKQLHDIFFTLEGFLDARTRMNVLPIPKHHFINFTNKDDRWQIPIKPSSELNSCWQRVKAILHESRTIDFGNEDIYE